MRNSLRVMGYIRILAIIYIFQGLLSCHSSTGNKSVVDPLFQLLPSSQTGIDFKNVVTGNGEMNIFSYHNFYNGGGVATGDLNNDGKPDIFFTSNQGENKLYINKGNWKFEDITAKAGLQSSHHWHTGVSIVDINADGWLDIYVCNAGTVTGDDHANELYINQGISPGGEIAFKEEAQKYGLDDKGQSTQAVFFDYDHDGDLDCFVLNNSPRSIESFDYTRKLRDIRDPVNGDRLYKNNDGRFADVSAQAGIYGSEIAFGLSVAAGDLNNDGWPDLYVANDFFEKDYLYINQHNGTFKEKINNAMGHISNGSMGSDMADINNDGYADIFTAEMLPENDYRLKTTVKFDDYDVENAKQVVDLHHQFTSNCLQLNNQDGTFSEIAQLAGVDATGWSWSALTFDFDNDGWKDIFVCNGISKDLTDQDFLAYFNNQNLISQIKQGNLTFSDLLQKIPSVPIPNYAFINQKNLQFANQSTASGFDTATFSNGAAYADLDNDGDLDLVINNENMDAFVYRNMASEKYHRHYLKLKLNGSAPNTFGYGARVTIFSKNNRQVLEQMPGRGFQSSVEPVLNFGLDTLNFVDSLIVHWPNEKMQVLRNIKADTVLTLNQSDAIENVNYPAQAVNTFYTNVSNSAITGNSFNRENEFVDFDVERLIPKMLSTEGPKIAVGDMNGDGLEDFYISSAIDDTSKIFIQQPGGHFIEKPQDVFKKDKYFENTGASFFDADGDGDADLILASGGNQAKLGSPSLQPRIYLNDGKGNFTRNDRALPGISVNASCVRIGDFNGDGKEDIFIGARNIPGSYGLPASSVLLQNNGNGSFADITRSVAPALLNIGMVTDAQWADIDDDGKKELIIVGDWMPVQIFKFTGKQFQKFKEIPHSSGWWNCLTVSDINGDGKPDFIAGNFGLNSRIKADGQHPAKMYTGDFDNNWQTECIPVYYKTDGKAYPYYLKGEMEAQVPMLKKKFLHFSEYAGKAINEIFTPGQLTKADTLTVEQTQTCIFLNDGKGNFTMQPLPVMAQLSPVYVSLVTDLNGDGIKDLFLAGNFYGLKPQAGRFDAGYGTSLLGNAAHQFYYIPALQSGLFINGQARDAAGIKSGSGDNFIIVAMNNEPLYVFRKK